MRNLNISIIALLESHLKNRRNFLQILSSAIVSGHFSADPFVSSKLLLHSLSDADDDDDEAALAFSKALFFHTQNPNIFAWNFMFKAYSRSSSPQESLALYNLMRRRDSPLFPDNYSFPFLLKACGRCLFPQKGQELHCLSFKLGFELDVFVQNGLISMYSLCGLMEEARRVFNLLPVFVRDVVSWNSVLSGYLQCERNEDALKVFVEMMEDGSVRPDQVTFVGVLTACARIGFLDLGRKIHGLVLGSGLELDVFLGSSLIDMYAKCGKMEDARKVFDGISDRNVVCWTSMIVGYAQSDSFKEAIELFREMQLHGVEADAATVASVISACGNLGALSHGRWVHSYSERWGSLMSLSVKNSLIDMYAKCGDIERALQIFHELSNRDVISWTAMITGLALNGESSRALHLFSQMAMSRDVMPNEVTFLGVLSACSHGGFVELGFVYFNAMPQSYKLTPRIEHYGCMVDLLGRANLLIEAEKFIREMPIQPDTVIWRSLLFACKTHQNIELAEFAAKKIEELKPRRSGVHVLLSNVYASASRWKDVNKLRRYMALQGTQKQPGCSFIELEGLVHEFFAADCSHSQIDSIYKTVDGINKVIRFETLDFDILNCQQ
ncbi:pentatricopeptide repeat-containing protein At2g22410, mitochondrial [Ziziphus jujuba]|uniref:Pentatricopeptide repeat-containing protein At2g22410, mitochondrial n=1 Tax=Ziziphus jujuba TaxID=326968 RepID=A0A6P6GAL2_ZIZJJ|nr:pentatricopeptide repeat-containing protein At2g22410, mitochondrial [Ziziphus jujuba]XP_060671984.1 pentatricopeptide repeat-containing protein At2g22410, mitochondrial [Ziziphus jujuba]